MWVIYFAGISESLKAVFGTVATMLAIVALFSSVFGYAVVQDLKIKAKVVVTFVSCAWVFSFIFACVGVAIPDKTTIYLMAGTRVAEDIVKSPEVKEINGKILTIINQKLDSIIEPTSKEK